MQIEAKLLEIRDKGTCILALAMRMQASTAFTGMGPSAIEHWFLHYRSGYPQDGSSIMLMCLSDGRATNDPYSWPDRGMGMRTMGTAHDWIIDHYDELSDGDVVDVQVILGETTESKVSERLTHECL
jgi:hypothetical protein